MLYGVGPDGVMATYGGDANLVGAFPEYAARFAGDDPMHTLLARSNAWVVPASRMECLSAFLSIPTAPNSSIISTFVSSCTRAFRMCAPHGRRDDRDRVVSGAGSARLHNRGRSDGAAGAPALRAAARRAARARQRQVVHLRVESLLERADPRPHFAFDTQARLLGHHPQPKGCSRPGRGISSPSILMTAVRRLAEIGQGRRLDHSPVFSVSLTNNVMSPLQADLHIQRTARDEAIVVVDLRAPACRRIWPRSQPATGSPRRKLRC